MKFSMKLTLNRAMDRLRSANLELPFFVELPMRYCPSLSCSLFLAAGLAVVCQAPRAKAELVKPAGVAATSFYGYGQHANNVINGSGLSSEDPSATHTESGSAAGQWHASVSYAGGGGAPVVADQSLTFSLPGVYKLNEVYIWQANQTNVFGRGISQFDLLVSSDGVNFSPALSDLSLELSQGGDIGAQALPFAEQSGVRFVKLQIDSSHNGITNDYVGLSEIRFAGTRTGSGPLHTSAAGSNSGSLFMQPVSNDLLQGAIASSSIATFSATGAGGSPGNELAGLTDGIGNADFTHRVIPSVNGGTWDLTYSADSLSLAAGESLDIDRINVFGFNTDNRRFVDFDVYYTTDDANWQTLFLGANNGSVVTAGTSLVTLLSLTDADAGDLVNGVRGLRFSFRPTNSGTGHSSMIEIDVLGSKAGGVAGDFDADGDVDGADFVAWQTNFPTASGATLAMGDADHDGDVDGADFVVWQTNFPFTPVGGVVAVPEPASMIPFILGGIIALARSRLFQRVDE